MWLAVQNAPLPEMQEGEVSELKKSIIIRIFKYIAFFSLLVIFTVAMALINNTAIELGILIAVVFMVFSIFTRITYLFFADVLPIGRSVHRIATGGFISRRVNETNPVKTFAMQLGIAILAILVNIAGFGQFLAFVAIVSAALSYFIICKSGLSRVSVRRLILGYLAISILLFSADTLGFFYLMSRISANPPPKPPSQDFALEYIIAWMSIHYPPFSVLTGILIAMCLRFDYQRHLDASETPGGFTLSTVQSPAPEFGQGVVVPSKLPAGFSKVYFATALATWVVMHTITFIYIILPHMDRVVRFVAGAAGLFVDLPVIMIVVMLVATIRGEFRKLWNYSEEWRVKPGEVRLL